MTLQLEKFKIRTKPMIPPDKEIALKFDLNIFNNTNKNDPNRKLLPPRYIGDGIVWLAALNGDNDPYYVLYDGGTNDLRIVENRNGAWRNIEVNQIQNLYGFIWKMLLRINDAERVIKCQ
jgi:hypothetical protein